MRTGLCPVTHRRRSSNTYVQVGVHATRTADASIEARIGRRITVTDGGCWLFRGRRDQYGRATINGHQVIVHRWVYETLIGEIPEGHDLHHDCVTPGCCNPLHCEPLTESQHHAEHSIMRRPGPRGTRPSDMLENVRRLDRRYPRENTMTDQTPVEPDPVDPEPDPDEDDEVGHPA